MSSFTIVLPCIYPLQEGKRSPVLGEHKSTVSAHLSALVPLSSRRAPAVAAVSSPLTWKKSQALPDGREEAATLSLIPLLLPLCLSWTLVHPAAVSHSLSSPASKTWPFFGGFIYLYLWLVSSSTCSNQLEARKAFGSGSLWTGLSLLRCWHWTRISSQTSAVWPWESRNKQGENLLFTGKTSYF